MDLSFIQNRFDFFIEQLTNLNSSQLSNMLINTYSSWQFDLVKTIYKSNASQFFKDMITVMYNGSIDNNGHYTLRSLKDHKYSYGWGLALVYQTDIDKWGFLSSTVENIGQLTSQFSHIPPNMDDQTGLWTEREVYIALSGQLAAYLVTGNDIYKDRANLYIDLCQQVITDAWGLLHNIYLHEGWREGTDPLHVFSPWMQSLLIATLEWASELIPERKNDCDELIVKMGNAVLVNGTYIVDENHTEYHPQLNNRRMPHYLAGPNGLYHDQSAWDAPHHALDVAYSVAVAYSKNPTDQLKTLTFDLLETAKWQLENRWLNLPGLRQLNWNFNNSDKIENYLNTLPPPPEEIVVEIVNIQNDTTHVELHQDEQKTTIDLSTLIWEDIVVNPPVNPPVVANEPDWSTITTTLGTVTGSRPWFMGYMDWKKNGKKGVVYVDHDNDQAPLAAHYFEHIGNGQFAPVEQFDWILGGQAPLVVKYNGNTYLVGDDHGQPTFGQVFENIGNLTFVIVQDQNIVNEVLSKTRRIFNVEDYTSMFGWPEGVLQPTQWNMATYRARYLKPDGSELVNFAGDGSDPISWNDGVKQSGFLQYFSNIGVIDVSTGLLPNGIQIWTNPTPLYNRERKNPWHWDGIVEGYDLNGSDETNFIVYYQRHNVGVQHGIFYFDGEWKEKFFDEWEHSWSVNYFDGRFVYVEPNNLGLITIKNNIVTYSRNNN